ncbi:hypothetical protein D3C81_1926530 [compost metagenome]
MAIGGTMPPAITAAIMKPFVFPLVVNTPIANVYAALLNGPPMSMDIIPARIIPRITALVVPRLFSPSISPILIQLNTGSIK